MEDSAVNGFAVSETPDVKFCNNCKKNIAAGNFTVHEVHCVRNIMLCPHCNDPVSKSELDNHVTDRHTQVNCPHCPAVLMKSDVEQHVADVHATEPCPECGQDIQKNLLEDHKRSVHSTTTCPLCRSVVDKSDFHQHQTSDCTKRQVACQYCSMMLAYSELGEHEDFCGSRTEPCPACGRYIMARDSHVHQETHCQYPFVQQKNDDGDTATGYNWHREHDDMWLHGGPFFNSFSPECLREMMESRLFDSHRLLFGQIGYLGPRSGLLPVDDPFANDQFSHLTEDSAPRPYYADGPRRDTQADDEHVTERNLFPETVTISSDNDDDDDDDDDSTLPCEFCKKLYIAKKLLKHQTACQLFSSVAGDNHSGGDEHHHPVHLSENHQPVGQETNEPIVIDADAVKRPDVPLVTDDSRSCTDSEDYLTADDVATDSVIIDDKPVEEETRVPVSRQPSLIPCEFCLELFDEHTVSEHQDVCYRQQTSALQALLDAGDSDPTDAASTYRYPYSVMSLEERERLGQ